MAEQLWKTVPVESTETMRRSAREEGPPAHYHDEPNFYFAEIWRLMLAAAPEPPPEALAQVLVAQRTEQGISNPEVAGSIPAEHANQLLRKIAYYIEPHWEGADPKLLETDWLYNEIVGQMSCMSEELDKAHDAIAQARLEAHNEAVEACAIVADAWAGRAVLLATGGMTAQELRTAVTIAIAKGIAGRCRALKKASP